MAKKSYSFYPGCSSQKAASASNYMVSVNSMCDTLDIELNEIPAPPFGEERRGLRFAKLLREAGLDDVSIDDEGLAALHSPCCPVADRVPHPQPHEESPWLVIDIDCEPLVP